MGIFIGESIRNLGYKRVRICKYTYGGANNYDNEIRCKIKELTNKNGVCFSANLVLVKIKYIQKMEQK